MKKFIITNSGNQEFQFKLQTSNSQVILTSRVYTNKSSCKNGISAVKNNSTLDSRYERKIASNDEFYFNLKAGNDQVIGTSQIYNSIYSRENGIASVKRNAPDAEIIDETI